MNKQIVTISALSLSVALSGCLSSSGTSNRFPVQNQIDCEAPANPAPLTNTDVLAVTSSSNCLVSFSSIDPGTITPIGSLNTVGNVVGLDFRPSTGELFALTAAGQLVQVDPVTAETTPVTPSVGPFDGRRFDIDFNPAADALRLTSDAGQNLRLGTDNLEINSNQPAVQDRVFGYLQGAVATAYTNVNPEQSGTEMFVISTDASAFFRQDPNEGLLTRIGSLFPDAESLDVKGYNVFTDANGNNEHYAVFTVDDVIGLYRIDPATAETTLLEVLPEPDADGNYMDLTISPVEGEADSRRFVVYEQTADDDFILNFVDLDVTMFSQGSMAIAFDSSTTVTGASGDDVLVGFDLRTTSETEAENTLFAVGISGDIYSFGDFEGGTAEAVMVATLSDSADSDMVLSGDRFDIDFNPRADLLRIVSDAGQNLRVNLDMQREIAGEDRDAGFAFVDGTIRLGDTMVPVPVAVAYRAEPLQLDGVTPSLDFQYVIDARDSSLARVVVPNDGALVAVGEGLLEDLTLPAAGSIQQSMDIFQIEPGIALAALRAENERASTLYSIDLMDGTATARGVIGGDSMPEGINAISVFIPDSSEEEPESD